jgi:transcriptional regulator with PAS, ATPase and Fis domain
MLDINSKNEEILVSPLIGTSKSIERIRELIDYTVDTGLNVLITGKSGVGKEVVAQNLYHKSERKNKPFIKVNCAALPEGLLESELFGFERGAFTGAERNKRGKFDLAHQGVIFLDEIGDMSLSLQSKLLHVLQGGEFSPLGSEKDVKSDVWVIAATNQELDKKVKGGLFREDLYYRLSTVKIYIPPLCNRPEDIPPLIDYFIEKYASQLDRKKISIPDSDAMEKLIAYSYPGNVRELQSILKRCIVIDNWEEVVDDLSIRDKPDANTTSGKKGLDEALNVDTLLDLIKTNSPGHASFSLKKIRKEAMDIIDKEVISYVLNQTGWNRTRASKILKINYKTLFNKINDLDIKQQQQIMIK